MEASVWVQRNVTDFARACIASWPRRVDERRVCLSWKTAYASSGLFQGDPRGLSVQLSTDGVTPFSANKICYSMWPIMLSVLNWPKYCRSGCHSCQWEGGTQVSRPLLGNCCRWADGIIWNFILWWLQRRVLYLAGALPQLCFGLPRVKQSFSL